MIPLVAVVSLRDQKSRTFKLWVPLVLFWLLFVPLGILFSPLMLVVCLMCRLNPLRVVSVLWLLLSAFRNAKFEVDHCMAAVSVCIF